MKLVSTRRLRAKSPGLARLCDAQVVPLICGVHLPSLGATSANAGEARPGFHSVPATIPRMPDFAAFAESKVWRWRRLKRVRSAVSDVMSGKEHCRAFVTPPTWWPARRSSTAPI